MNYPVRYNAITPKIEFYSQVVKMHKKASDYLLSFPWCKKLKNSSIYLNLGSTFCIFLFEIVNGASNYDNYLWAIVGDLPSMYLDIHGPKTTTEVLEDYIKLADDWIVHIKENKTVAECYPFEAGPTLEMAIMLEKRIFFMKNTLIHNIEEIILTLKQ